MAKRIATNIEWDTDGEDVVLPSEVEIPDNIEEDAIADYLSDEYGFCVFGFGIEKEQKKETKKRKKRIADCKIKLNTKQ